MSKEENLETAKEYDYIIWDLAPTNSIVNRNALLTCSNIIFIDQYGTMESISAIDTFLNEYKLNSEELEQRELVKILKLQPKELSLLKSHWASSEEITARRMQR